MIHTSEGQCTCTMYSVLYMMRSHIENGEELPAVIDVGRTLIVKEEPTHVHV